MSGLVSNIITVWCSLYWPYGWIAVAGRLVGWGCWWAVSVLTLAVVLVLFFSSIALVPFGFIGGEFFAKSDSGEFLVQIELPKDASEQSNFMAQKGRSF
jgi:multidrug efflux pump subunit AcrB